MTTSPNHPDPLLDIHSVNICFGGLRAVCDFHLQLRPGELHGLIGPNGAGKTTVFNLITGVYRPGTGKIHLAGKPITGFSPHRIASAGITRTFQNIRLFSDLNVLDNVRVGCHLRAKHGMPASIFRTAGFFGEERAITQRSLEILDIFNLAHRKNELAKNLPYGDQRRLEIARALATDPKLLLLDEPAAGMNPHEKKDLAALIQKLRAQWKLTILLIEHDMALVMDICDRITVLDYGLVIAVGSPQQVQRDPKVIAAYLGQAAEQTTAH